MEKRTVSLEAENARLKGRAGGAEAFEAELKRLRGEVAGLKGENAGLKGEVARLRRENCWLRWLRTAPAAAVVGVAAAPVDQGAIAPGTLFAGKSREVASLDFVRPAIFLFAHDGGRWDFDAVRAKVAGKAPTVVLVKSELGSCGGHSAAPRAAAGFDYVSDPTGASFVCSIEPRIKRFAFANKGKRLSAAASLGTAV